MKKKLTVLVALLLLVTVSVGGTLAWLATQTDPVTNTFTPSHVTTAVDEQIKGSTKEKVSITNTGDTSAYIRATYVVNWVDSEGNIYAAQPVADTNYTVTMGTGWTQDTTDRYWYCDSVIAPGNMTPVLITSIAPNGAAPEGYTLQVTIIAEGIQSQGMGATGAKNAFAIAAGAATE